MPHQHRIIFFGSSAFSVPSLIKLSQEAEYIITAVVTSRDKPVGRKHVLTPNPVRVAAEHLSIPVLMPQTLRDPQFASALQAHTPDVFAIVSYGKIIPASLLTIPPWGAVNVHPSLLPRYRGPSPIQQAIANGDTETGIAIMRIDEEMDHGPILRTQLYALDPEQTFPAISEYLSNAGAKLLADTLRDYLRGTLKPLPQNHTKATYTSIITKEDGRIDWHSGAKELYNRYRAFDPWPGIYAFWKRSSGSPIKITLKKIALEDTASSHDTPGTVVRSSSGDLLVQCGTGTIRIDALQQEGKKVLSARDFLNGNPQFAHSILH